MMMHMTVPSAAVVVDPIACHKRTIHWFSANSRTAKLKTWPQFSSCMSQNDFLPMGEVEGLCHWERSKEDDLNEETTN